MAVLQVSQTKNFSSDLLANIDQITFTNISPNIDVTATFSASQFNGSKIVTDPLITGNTQINRIVVNAVTDFSAADWSFASWTSKDSMTINGNRFANALTGSTVADTINGASGADTINGGGSGDKLNGSTGNDTFIYDVTTATGSGETVDGGADTDTLRFDVAGVQARNLTFQGIERIAFGTGPSGASLNGNSLAAAGGLTIVGGAAANALSVFGSNLDYSALQFSGWDEAVDALTFNSATNGIASSIVATSASDSIIIADGSSQFTSADGGDGDDRFAITAPPAATFTLDGGLGEDTLVVATPPAQIVSLLNDTMSSVERLEFANNAGNGTVQFRAAIFDTELNVIAGNGAVNELGIIATGGGTTDLRGLTFENWQSSSATPDIIKIIMGPGSTVIGTTESDTMLGGTGNDVLQGFSGADILDGGDGLDMLNYALSDAAVSVDLASGNVSGGHAEGDTISDFERVTGSKFDDTLTGSDGANRLSGGNGTDTLSGALGADVLNGQGNNDFLFGGNGRDVLIGGTGFDHMTGGLQGDTFRFLSVADSAAGIQRDLIFDFQQTLDKIDVSLIATGSANAEFEFIDSDAFTSTPGQIRFEFVGDNTVISLNTDTDTQSESQVSLIGKFTLTTADFLL